MRVRRLGLVFLLLGSAVSSAFAGDTPDGGGRAGAPPAAKPGPGAPATKDGAKTPAPDAQKSGTAADPQPGAKTAPAAKPAENAKPVPRDIPEIERTSPKSLDDALARLGRLRCDIDFREMSLEDAVDFVSKVGRMNAIVSPALRVKGLDGIPKVTLKLKDVSLRQVAELVAKFSGTKLAVRDGVLLFTTPEEARGEPVLQIYTLSDLTFKLRNFPGPDIRIHLKGAEFEPEKESDVASPFDDPETVIALIKKMTGDGTWDDGDVSISGDERRLVVRQYPAVHKEIRRLLAVLRSAK